MVFDNMRRIIPWMFVFVISFAQGPLHKNSERCDGKSNITVPEGHYVEVNISFTTTDGLPCRYGNYFEIRDGSQPTDELLGEFCHFYKHEEYVVRSSGNSIWLRIHGQGAAFLYGRGRIHVHYTAKPLNLTVTPNINEVITTQFVLHNQSLFLWCPAEGAPAPNIVWRKNGVVVQNSTNVRYKLTVEGNKDNYSCEVNRQGNLTKKELAVLIERCPDPCQCTSLRGTYSPLSVSCRGIGVKSLPRTLPLATKSWSLDTNLMCCHLNKEDADCDFAFNDNFADCHSMFRNLAPRISIWVVGVVSLIGAGFVIFWRLKHKEKKERNIVQNIMLMNLAISDGLMGIYLITVGVKDRVWSGAYYLHDSEWRSSWSCQVTGAISIMSSEVSVMLIALISADRMKNVVFPYKGKSLTRNMTHTCCLAIWAIGALIAFFPMFDIRYFEDPISFNHYYGRTVVCLPLQLTDDLPSGWEYSVGVFVVLNLILFAFIVVAYALILIKTYTSSWRLVHQGTARERRARSQAANFKREKSLTKRVLFIILTDALCWFPVIVIGFKSISEAAFTSPGDLTVWFAVFVLPINSVLNPLVYTIFTPQVRKPLKRKLRQLWRWLRRVCSFGQAPEAEEEEEENDEEESEDDEEEEYDEEAQGDDSMEMGALGLPHLGEDDGASSHDMQPAIQVAEGVILKRRPIRSATVAKKQQTERVTFSSDPDIRRSKTLELGDNRRQLSAEEDEKKNDKADVGEHPAPHEEKAVTPSEATEEGGEEETRV